MKIIMALMGLDIGGAETHVVELSKELCRMGHEIIVVSNGGSYQEELNQFGIKHIWAPLNKRNPINAIRAFFIFRSLIKREKPDLVHAHARIPAFVCALVKRTLNFKFVTTVHFNFNTNLGLRQLTDWGIKTIAVSEDLKKYLTENYGIQEKNIFTTINGIDTDRFIRGTDYSGVEKELNLNTEAKRIIYVSRLTDGVCKPAFILLDILEELDNQIPGIELLIVGGGNMLNLLKTKAEEINNHLGRTAAVLTGPRTDINALIAAADIGIGVSRAALEMMAEEKPVILAGHQGYMGIYNEGILSAAIQNNFTCRGFSIAEGDTYKRDILRLFELTEAQNRYLGECGRETVEQYYSVKKMAADNMLMYKEALLEGTYDVAISGYYGYYNAGDDALLFAMIDTLKEQKNDIRIVVLSRRPEETSKLYGVESINRFDLFKVIRTLKCTKLFINGGGSLIQDVTSTKSLIYYLGGMVLALTCGIKVMLYANGIGPLKRKLNRYLAAKVLNAVDYITLRDEDSKTEIDRIGVKNPNVRVTADPAFNFKDKKSFVVDNILTDIGLKAGQGFVCISVRKWNNSSKDMPQKIASMADYIASVHGLIPVFLPMQYPYDASYSRSIINLMKNKALFLDTRLSVEDTIGVVARAQLVIAVRLHTLIYAATVHVPAIGIVYDPKINGFLRYIGQPYYLDPRGLSTDEYKALIDTCIEKREEIVGLLKQTSINMAQKAIDNANIAIQLIQGR